MHTLAPGGTLRPEEEPLNATIHGIGCALAVVGAVAVLWSRDTVDGLAIACVVYAVSLVALYAASTTSHAVQEPAAKHRLRCLDQGAIYLLIAGTYTPFIWTGLDGIPRVLLMASVWGAAAFGFYAKVVTQHRVNAVATRTYVLLGWLPAVPLAGSVTTDCLVWMAAGGICYTAGIAFLKLDDRYRFFHAAWHISVLAGSGCHYYAIYRYVLNAAG